MEALALDGGGISAAVSDTIDLSMVDDIDDATVAIVARPSSSHNTKETAIVIDSSDDDEGGGGNESHAGLNVLAAAHAAGNAAIGYAASHFDGNGRNGIRAVRRATNGPSNIGRYARHASAIAAGRSRAFTVAHRRRNFARNVFTTDGGAFNTNDDSAAGSLARFTKNAGMPFACDHCEERFYTVRRKRKHEKTCQRKRMQVKAERKNGKVSIFDCLIETCSRPRHRPWWKMIVTGNNWEHHYAYN